MVYNNDIIFFLLLIMIRFDCYLAYVSLVLYSPLEVEHLLRVWLNCCLTYMFTIGYFVRDSLGV